MKFLKPQKVLPSYFYQIRKDIEKLFYILMIHPLIELIEKETKMQIILNSKFTAIESALRNGKLQYHNGIFSGELSAMIGKEIRDMGGSFDHRMRIYKIDEKLLPREIKQQADIAQMKAREMNTKILDELKDLQERIDEKLEKANIDFLSGIDKIHKDFRDSAKDIAIMPQVSDEMKKSMAKQYNDNIKLSIRKWSHENIEHLRETVEGNAYEGYRFDKLIEGIKENYSVSQNKAEFLARQETSLFMAKFRKERFREADVHYYKWSARLMARPDHKVLNQRFFSYDNPPIVNKETGRRGNPGEDYGCIIGESNIEIAFGIEKCFRRWYTGELTEIILESGKTIRATPNHPVLTLRGWKAISSLNDADHVINLGDELIQSFEKDTDNRVTTIREIFNAMSKNFPCLTRHTTRKQFHGDRMADGYVDIINTTGCLTFGFQSKFMQFFKKFFFSGPKTFAFGLRSMFKHFYPFIFRDKFCRFMSFHCDRFTLFIRHTLAPYSLSFAHSSYMNTSFEKSSTNDISSNTNMLSNSKFTFPRLVCLNNRENINFNPIIKTFSAFTGRNRKSGCSEFHGKIIGMKADDLCGFVQGQSFIKKFDRVIKVNRQNFSGHVFNLQTKNNWYTTNGIIIHNCLCADIPIVGEVSVSKVG